MAADRRAERTAPVRQRAAPAAVQRSAAPAAVAPARALQTRLGNQATQAFVSRSVATSIQASRAARLPPKVSKPTDPAEREAEETAKKVLRMRDAPSAKPQPSQTVAKGTVQREPAARPAAAAGATPSSFGIVSGPGAPLPAPVRRHMEPRFGANFSGVRVHTGDGAAKQSATLGASAFTIGRDIFFGKNKFQPDTSSGRELLAHELTHTIQQGAARQGTIQRSEAVDVSHGVEPHVQRSWFDIPNPREYFAGKAALIPGFTMLTVVIGFNPITNQRVERNAGNILRGAIGLIPGGTFIAEALNNHGIFDRISQWVAVQFETIRNIGATIYQDIETFIESFKLTDLADPGAVWDRAKAIVTRPIDRIIAFAVGIKDGIVGLIKDAILKPIAAFARTTRGYPLLCTILGRDPITGEPVPQDLEALLGGFLKFIGEDELWETMKKAQAVPRAFAWFNSAVNALRGFIAEIPGLFVAAFRSLEIVDILLIPRAFLKIASVFGNFAVRFVTWGAQAVWTLLEIIFDVVSPGALAYIKKTGAALKSILKNPLPFVGNLVKAAKLGFMNFAANFLDHLKAGLIAWLTGALPGIYIPKAFSLVEIAKFVMSVLGLTWANIRAKLVKATSETVVKTLETGFDIVVTLVREGPAAAWDKIKEQLANLKDMAIGAITDFIVDMVVKKAVPKLISMFIPGAGFISAILSIYDTIMVFVNRIKQIISVVTAFIDSLIAISQGAIGAAAARVENALATGLSLAINFAAGFVGLGNVADKVMGVLNKIRAPIDKALDWLVNWIVTAAKKLFAAGKAGVAKIIGWWKEKLGFKNKGGETHTLQFIGEGETATLGIATELMTARAYLDQHPDKGTPAWNKANAALKDATQIVFSQAKQQKEDKDKRATIKTTLTTLGAALAELSGQPPTVADYGTTTPPSYGNPAKVDVLVGEAKGGSRTGPWPEKAEGYKEIFEAGLTTATDRWVQMHIISEKLGGSGTDPENLVPAPQSINAGPFRSFEHMTAALAKTKSGPAKNRLWVEVQILGKKTKATGLIGRAGLYLWKGAKAAQKWLKEETPSFTVTAAIPEPQLKGPRKLVLNFTSKTEMKRDFGISDATAKLVQEGRMYTSLKQFETSMKDRGATQQQIDAVLNRGPVLDSP